MTKEIKHIRNKFKNNVLTYTFIIIGTVLVLGVVLSTLLDLGAFSQLEPFKAQIHHTVQALVYSCIGLVCLGIGIERMADLGKLEDTLEHQNSTLDKQNILIEAQTKEFKEIHCKLDNIHSLSDKINIQTDIIGQMTNVREKYFDKFLNEIFDDFIDDSIEFFQNAIKHREIKFTEYDRFEKAYVKCLELLPKSEFFATASAHSSYFWTGEHEENNAIENAIIEFTNANENAGKMNRIFLLEDGDMDDPNCIATFNNQLTLGVNVYTVPKSKLSLNNQKYFVVESSRKISWHVFTDNKNKIIKFIYSTDEREISKYHNIFQTLMKSGSIKKYEKK